MHSSIPFVALFVAGVLGSPLGLFDGLQIKNIGRDIVTEVVAVTEVVTVTVTGQVPTTTSTSAIAKVHKAYHSGAYRHWHRTGTRTRTRTRSRAFSTRAAVTSTVSPSSPAIVSPAPTSTSISSSSDAVVVPTTSDVEVVSTTSEAEVVSTTSEAEVLLTTSEAVVVPTTSELVVVPTTSEVVVVPTSTPSAAAPTSELSSSDTSPLSGGVSLLTTINKYRQLYSLPTLSWSSVLYKNALKTGTDGNGVTQTHQLNPGSFAQVITPGMSTAVVDLSGNTPFELSYVAWLCEVSSDPQLSAGNKCDVVEEVLHMRYSSTGHHDILNSRKYTQIGCAFAKNPRAAATSVYQGLWVCDLAF